MLALTKKTSYGLIAMSHLAKLDAGAVVSAREISAMYGMPMGLLMNVLKELCSAGYVESSRGKLGGYRLARSPQQINLADLITAIERPVRQAECLTHESGDHQVCTIDVMSRCPVADPVHRVHRKLIDFLKKVTLAEIVEPTLASAATPAPQPAESTEGK